MRRLGWLFGAFLLVACNNVGRTRMLGGGGGGAASSASDGGLLTGGGGGGPVCEGICARAPSLPFTRIAMVSIAKMGEAVQPCPTWAPVVGFEGSADMHVAPTACPVCSCAPAECVLPEQMHVSAAKCANADGAPSVSFDAPVAWEGNCTADNGIAKNLLCGGVPCAQSLSIAAPIVEPCNPIAQGEMVRPDPTWGTSARECLINTDSDGGGCDNGAWCAPEPPEGFALCLFVTGDYPCSFDVYTDRTVVYPNVGGTVETRDCTPCECGDPEGGDCSAFVSVFTDGACGALLATNMLVSGEPGCFDVPSGSALGSKSASFVVDKPGACAQAGGEALGDLQPAAPVTLCCAPPGASTK